MDFNELEPQRRELSDWEKTLCAKVMADWRSQGKLKFRRQPNFITVPVTLILAGFLIFLAVHVPQVALGSKIVSVPWPYKAPAKISIRKGEASGVRLSQASDKFFDAKSKTIELRAEIIDSGRLSWVYSTLGGR